MIRSISGVIALLVLACGLAPAQTLPVGRYPLQFDHLPTSWDEGLPLGNGMLGALMWQKNDRFRIALDRADLWDLRPMENLDRPEWSFDWVWQQWKKGDYSPVQALFDAPYERNPAPSKIPAGALEFPSSQWGPVVSAQLHLLHATAELRWANGVRCTLFVAGHQHAGWFRFTGVTADCLPQFAAPIFHSAPNPLSEANSTEGQDLLRLGYPPGVWQTHPTSIRYEQTGWNGFQYRVAVQWRFRKGVLEGCWTVESNREKPKQSIDAYWQTGFQKTWSAHQKHWEKYWKAADLQVPDALLQKQWYLEMYKFGAATGNQAPPISLQAIWTADNGRLPPWKGDLHNDLNVQLSYWPAYSANQLERSMGLIDWLERHKPAFEQYTRQYFQRPGLNMPGVSTLDGAPMGGWIQYAFGPTVSAWMGHHYYLQWRYSMDTAFLSQKAYPWLRETARFLTAFSIQNEKGQRQLPLSSSPEIFDNSSRAWFEQTTNFDLGLIRWTLEKTAELAECLGHQTEAAYWRQTLSEWPELNVDPASGLRFAPGVPYAESHRHFSHLVAWHPLGLLDVSQGEAEAKVIQNTLSNLKKHGPSAWCGYSYSWLGNLCARAGDGSAAAEALRIFAAHFCLKNSFHANGDQSGKGFSNYTYRPFTLEGNFAFAAGVQEMLLQSHAGYLHLFPAIPAEWKDVSFRQLRAEGAFLVSSSIKNGYLTSIEVYSEKGGQLRLRQNQKWEQWKANRRYRIEGSLLVIDTRPGDRILLYPVQSGAQE